MNGCNEMTIDNFVNEQLKQLKIDYEKAKPNCHSTKNTILPHLRAKIEAYQEIYDYLNSLEYMKQEFENNINKNAGEYYQKRYT